MIITTIKPALKDCLVTVVSLAYISPIINHGSKRPLSGRYKQV